MSVRPTKEPCKRQPAAGCASPIAGLHTELGGWQAASAKTIGAALADAQKRLKDMNPTGQRGEIRGVLSDKAAGEPTAARAGRHRAWSWQCPASAAGLIYCHTQTSTFPVSRSPRIRNLHTSAGASAIATP